MIKESTTRLLLCGILVICSLFLISCEDDSGTPCRISGDQTSTTSTGTEGSFLNPQSLDCQSRLCLATPATDVIQAQCTKICDSDGDCPDKTDTCDVGFKCVVGVIVGPFKFCKMCVCKKFTTGHEGKTPPADITPNCPKL